MFCASVLVFDGTEGVGSRFHVLHSRTHFRRCRVCQVPFSCFAVPSSFSAVLRVSGVIFMFCASRLVFGGTEGVGSSFNVLRFRTHFRWCRVCHVPFSCFTRPDSFSAVPRVKGLVFMFCVPGLIFGGTEGVRSCFHVLLSRTCFWRCGGRQVLFSCFALPVTCSAVSRASGPVFMFFTPGLVFDGTEGVGTRFHVLRAQTHFRR
jgi:hypothetical protein